MNRSGYSEDCSNLELYRQTVANAIMGKRGQAFLRELAAAMDAMPEKRLITDELIDEDGECCTIGVICKARGIDVSKVDVDDPAAVGKLVGIATAMAAEIEFKNDGFGDPWEPENSTPEKRWEYMRKWVEKNLVKGVAP